MKRPILTECPTSSIWSLIIPLMMIVLIFLLVVPAQAQLRGARLSDTNFNINSMQTHGFWKVKRYQKGYTLKRKRVRRRSVRRRSYRSRRRVRSVRSVRRVRISLPKKKTVRSVYRPVKRRLTKIRKEKK